MKNKVQLAIEKYGMIQSGDHIIAALSGGADSVCLLHLLKDLQKEMNFTLSACHVNHQLRGEESERDREFCEKLCAELEISLRVFCVDVRGEGLRTKESEETCARRLRYEAFDRLEGKVATAHTADDSMETTLWNLMRGTALKGLCGIAPTRGKYVRPLIDCTAQEVRTYCRTQHWCYVTDSTNDSDNYTRNRIRHRLVPLLQSENPQIAKTVRRMQEALLTDEKFLESETCRALDSANLDGGFSCKKLNELPLSLRRRAVAEILKQHEVAVEYARLCAVEKMLSDGRGKLSVDGNRNVSVKNGVLSVNAEEKEGSPFEFPAVIGEWMPVSGTKKVKLTVIDGENVINSKKVNQKVLKKYMDYDKITHGLVIRSRKNGDCVRLASNPMTKSLKKLFNEKKIPLSQRSRLTVLADENGILWVEGFGCDQRCCADENTRRMLTVVFDEKTEDGKK